MAVTWLYLPLTLSRLDLRNLGMRAWAVHLRYIRFSQKSLGVLGWEETLPWACWYNKLHFAICMSFWVSLFPRTCDCNNSLSGWHSPRLPQVSMWTPQSQNLLWSSVLPLYPDTKLNLRVLGKAEKKSFTDLPGKVGWCFQNCVSQPGSGSEEFYSNGSKRPWSAHGHSSDGLVMRFVADSIINLLVPIGLRSMCLWAAYSYFSHLVEVSVSVKQLKDIVMCIPWEGNQDFPPRLPYCYLIVPPFLLSLCIPFLLLATVWTCPLEFREGPGGWIKHISCNQEMGKSERLLCSEAPQGFAWFHLLHFPLLEQTICEEVTAVLGTSQT